MWHGWEEGIYFAFHPENRCCFFLNLVLFTRGCDEHCRVFVSTLLLLSQSANMSIFSVF